MLTENQKMAMDLLNKGIENAIKITSIVPDEIEICHKEITDVERVLLTSLIDIDYKLRTLRSSIECTEVQNCESIDELYDKMYNVCHTIHFQFKILPENAYKSVLYIMLDKVLRNVRDTMDDVRYRMFNLLNNY